MRVMLAEIMFLSHVLSRIQTIPATRRFGGWETRYCKYPSSYPAKRPQLQRDFLRGFFCRGIQNKISTCCCDFMRCICTTSALLYRPYLCCYKPDISIQTFNYLPCHSNLLFHTLIYTYVGYVRAKHVGERICIALVMVTS